MFNRKPKQDEALTEQATSFAHVNVDGLIGDAQAVSVQFLRCIYSQDIMSFPPQRLSEKMYYASIDFINRDRQKMNIRMMDSLNLLCYNFIYENNETVYAVTPIIYEANYRVTGRYGDGKTMNTFAETRAALFKFELFDRGGYMLTAFKDEGVITG